MVRPSPALQARLRFSTKRVGRGFYRGNKVGSTGAHTQYGAYIIDWRKVKNYNVPDLKDFKLTPFVTREIGVREYDSSYEDRYNPEESQAPNPFALDATDASSMSIDGQQKRVLRYLDSWRKQNPTEFDHWVTYQYNQRMEAGDHQAAASEIDAEPRQQRREEWIASLSGEEKRAVEQESAEQTKRQS